MPGIMLHSALSRENAEKEIEQENQLSRTENKGRNGDEDIDRLLRHQEHILRWIVNTPHLAANADNMHREEDRVNTDETQPEMNLAERFVHEAAEHLREPEI